MPLLPATALAADSNISPPLGRGTLVGDIILGARELINDLPQVLSPPGNEMQVLSGCSPQVITLPPGSYYVALTYRPGSAATPWGETTPSTVWGPIAVDAVNSIQVTGSIPAGVGSVAAYFGTDSSHLNSVVTFSTTPFEIVSAGALSAPPIRNSAYLPDADGRSITAAALYRWLNEGMDQASTICYGLPDFGAVATVNGQPIYPVQGRWTKLSNGWYDGYPLFLGRQTDVFRRNIVTGTVGTILLYQSNNRFVVEVWPQPSRTAGTAYTTVDVGSFDSAIPIQLDGGNRWTIGFGLCSLSTPDDPNYEIVQFARNDSLQLYGVTRGMQGTIPYPWPAGTLVTELNLMWAGQRVPTGYRLGDSTSTFYLPAGWADAMETYILARFKKAEQQYQEATVLQKEFTAKVQHLMATRIIVGPRQIQVYAGRGSETFPGLGSPFGGVIVP